MFLPLHGAGLYDRDGNISVSDYVVSSYIPTLSALLRTSPTTPDYKIVVTIQPHAPGCSNLPGTHDELSKILHVVQRENVITLGAGDAPASLENVILHLSDASIAHFACHGKQNFSNPLESCLVLDGGEKLKVSQLMKTPLPNASLVFLNACETAMGEENLPDEAIHLAASMLFAGFHGAVATMW